MTCSSTSSGPQIPQDLRQNNTDPSSGWIVQKFGGTSVGKFAVKIAEDIVSNYIDRNKIVIVCSARSGSTKALGTTNLLLRAASEALRRQIQHPDTPGSVTPTSRGLFGQFADPASGSQSPNTSVDLIRKEHLLAARTFIRDPDILQELESEIERDCNWLQNFLFAAQVIDEVSLRSKDSIVGLGERLSCKIMTGVLRDRGVDAEYVSLEHIVPDAEDSDIRQEAILDQHFYDRLAVALGERINQCSPRVPVVTGFFGPVPGSLLHQVGRGYTDLLSALLAVGLQASELQIWKEVDGIFTADPRKVATARLISIITPDEAAELTYYGSEVVHPFTMEQVIRKKIPIRIKNVGNPRGAGTVIHPDPDAEAVQQGDTEGVSEPASSSSLDSAVAAAHQQHKRLPTAVTTKDHIIVLNVHSNRKSVSHGFYAGIFGALDRFGVVVDLISTSEVHVSMAIEELTKKVLDRLVRELMKSGTVTVHPGMAILSLVGKQMRNMVGIAGRMFTTLAQGDVNIEMISQGASEINISCVIDARDAVKALNLIHESCLQIKPEGSMGRVGPWLF